MRIGILRKIAKHPFFRGMCIAACFQLAGCTPIDTVEDAPRLSGVLLDGGRPVVNADVVLFTEVGKKTVGTRTDAAGRFNLGPIKHAEAFTLPTGDRFRSYGLRFRAGGELYASHATQVPGWANTHGVVCDLSAGGSVLKDRSVIFLDRRIPYLESKSSTSGLRCWDPRQPKLDRRMRQPATP